MYPLQGPAASSLPLQKADDNALGLRINQRLVAEVLQIAADHVVLGLQGVPVVARLTSPEQAALLAERKTAQFIVKGLSDQGLTLQVTNPAGAAGAGAAQELLPALLDQAGRPATPANLTLAQALLDQGLPVTAELVDDLAATLNGLQTWGSAEARTAAGAKAAGLPLSPGALDLLATAPTDLGGTLKQLQTSLRELKTANLPPQIAEMVQTAKEVLSELNLEPKAAPADLATQMQTIVAKLGRSVEHALAGAVPNGPVETGLLTLAQLQHALTQVTPARPELTNLARQLDQFVDAARLEHFRNVSPSPVPPDGRWLSLPLPVQPAGDNAQLRIAYDSRGAGTTIDPQHTRLTVVFPLAEGQALQVDLMVINRQIGAWVTASDEALRTEAEAELPDLATGLAGLGFSLKTARCEVGQPAATPEPPRPAAAPRRVNVKA